MSYSLSAITKKNVHPKMMFHNDMIFLMLRTTMPCNISRIKIRNINVMLFIKQYHYFQYFFPSSLNFWIKILVEQTNCISFSIYWDCFCKVWQWQSIIPIISFIMCKINMNLNQDKMHYIASSYYKWYKNVSSNKYQQLILKCQFDFILY